MDINELAHRAEEQMKGLFERGLDRDIPSQQSYVDLVYEPQEEIPLILFDQMVERFIAHLQSKGAKHWYELPKTKPYQCSEPGMVRILLNMEYKTWDEYGAPVLLYLLRMDMLWST